MNGKSSSDLIEKNFTLSIKCNSDRFSLKWKQCAVIYQDNYFHWWKVFKYGVFSGPYFGTFHTMKGCRYSQLFFKKGFWKYWKIH